MTAEEFINNRVDQVLTRDDAERVWLAELLEAYAEHETNPMVFEIAELKNERTLLQNKVEELKGLLKRIAEEKGNWVSLNWDEDIKQALKE